VVSLDEAHLHWLLLREEAKTALGEVEATGTRAAPRRRRRQS